MTDFDGLRQAVHDETCPTRFAHGWEQCISAISRAAAQDAVDVLSRNSRDARGVRRVLHDWTCMSGDWCVGDDHATRTQSLRARAARRWFLAASQVSA